MSELIVERIGGIAGFGIPGSRLKSRGRCPLANLSAADRTAVDRLFAKPASHRALPDAFRYRITRTTANGPETVEAPESQVPAALVACVKDELE